MRIERVVVVGGTTILRRRTERSLARIGVGIDAFCNETDLAETLTDAPTWVLRAGAWTLAEKFSFDAIPPSATGRPLLGFGAIRGDSAWTQLLERSAGLLEDGESHPRVTSLFAHDGTALVPHDDEGLDALAWRLASSGMRAVRLHLLDVGFGTPLRVSMIVATLHRGGAERLVLDLAAELRARGTEVFVAVLGRPDCETYDAPAGTFFVCEHGSASERTDLLTRTTLHFGADVIHAHLLSEKELVSLADLAVPIVTTIHNDRPAWPAGFTGERVLALGCSWRVQSELATTCEQVRVATNAVDRRRLGVSQDRNQIRQRLELPPNALVVLCVANPRPQKRLELAVGVVRALRDRGLEAHLVIAGAPLRGNGPAVIASRELDLAVRAAGLEHCVRRVGSLADVAPLYAAADVLLTTSAYEGLSIVQLEALAAGLPVVTTEVGGARELALTHRGYYVTEPDQLADAVVMAHEGPRPELADAFTIEAAAAHHERLYRGAIGTPRRGGLLLVANNFSTGGAQASARRLLLGLHGRGREVAGAVLQEQLSFPTPRRRELEAAGIPVFVAPRVGTCDAAVTAAAIADFARERDVSAVAFWNVIPQYKLLVADELVGVPLFDVSPGEMFFSELERYFERPRADLPYFEPRDYATLLRAVVVKYSRERERAATLGVPVSVIPNGVAPRTFRPRAPRNPLVVGTLARIAPNKKLEQLVFAMHHARGCELRIAGGVELGKEDYARELRALANGLAITWVGEQNAEPFLDELDAFAMVSEPEGCPNALLEAMAASLPIAATDAGGASELLGEAGLVVPRGDSAALGATLTRLSEDASLRARLGRAACDRVHTHFSIDRMLDAYEALFFDSIHPRSA